MENINEYIGIAAAVIAIASQLAAIFGKPKIIEAIKPLSAILDVLAGNYGKAKNAEKPAE